MNNFNSIQSWWRSPLARLIWQTPLLIVAILALILLSIYQEAVHDINAGIQTVINEDAAAFAQVYAHHGVRALIPAVEERNRTLDSSAIFLLVDGKGQHLAGDVMDWPAGVSKNNDTWFSISDESDTLVGKVLHFRDGSDLLIAQHSPLNRFRNHLAARLILATVLAFLGSLLLGAWTLGRFRRRLQVMEQSAQRILGGDLSQRLLLAGHHDELDELAHEFNQAFTEIEKLMDATRHVSSAIAHDMRRPIAALRYRLEELSRRDDLPEGLQEQIFTLLQQTDESLNTFSALLRLARLESGSYGPKHEPVDVAALITEVADTYEPVANAHHMQLVSHCDAAQVLGDWNLLFLSLQNLLDNAIHYGLNRIEINSVCTGQHVTISVRDHGYGVDESILPKLFDRFFRGDEARTTGGSGIGLALVRAVAEIHGGQATVVNANPGLCVSIQLPLLAVQS